MPAADAGKNLSELIKKAINDCQLTHSEHQQIVAQVHADHQIDPTERQLLGQLQEMIANGTIKKNAD